MIPKTPILLEIKIKAKTNKKGCRQGQEGYRTLNSFRKKLFIGIAAGAVLIGALVWAFVFAPAATVIITARTTTVPVSGVVTLGTTTDAEVGTKATPPKQSSAKQVLILRQRDRRPGHKSERSRLHYLFRVLQYHLVHRQFLRAQG